MRKGVWRRVWIVIGVVLCVLFAMVACTDADITSDAIDAGITPGVGTDAEELTPPEGAVDPADEDGAIADDSENNSENDSESDGTSSEGEGTPAGEGDADSTGGDAEGDDGSTSYLDFLYETDRLAYYRYAAESGLFDLLSLDMFDLSSPDAKGRYPYLSVEENICGDYDLVAYDAERTARICIAADGTAKVYGTFGEVDVILYGTYDKDFEIITESGETFALSEDVTREGKLLYFLPIGDTTYSLSPKVEIGAVVTNEWKDALLARLSEIAGEVPAGDEEAGDEGSGEVGGESGEDGGETGEGEHTDGDGEDGGASEPSGDDSTPRVDERTRIAESGCYTFLQSVGGKAKVTGTPIIGEEGEDYTVVFHDMSQDEYAAAMLIWRDEGNIVSMDKGTQIVFFRMIEGKGFSFNVMIEGVAAPYTMTVWVQGGYAS